MEVIALANLANAIATFLLGLGIGLHLTKYQYWSWVSLITGCVLVVGVHAVPH